MPAAIVPKETIARRKRRPGAKRQRTRRKISEGAGAGAGAVTANAVAAVGVATEAAVGTSRTVMMTEGGHGQEEKKKLRTSATTQTLVCMS
jgi:hypothetical protein